VILVYHCQGVGVVGSIILLSYAMLCYAIPFYSLPTICRGLYDTLGCRSVVVDLNKVVGCDNLSYLRLSFYSPLLWSQFNRSDSHRAWKVFTEHSQAKEAI
jgi:hypothetical protein